ncbi:hypothetical protein R0131_00090 [Clostridium sp. AL.422]|uniref:hypothetical protein n=1 Tax=Clostridium TaxID=1485 RepID=UPI00293DFD33|nr:MULTISPECIES: hypothetical protein [unclassified Clostridium]MDV4149228.1 hypothetical protein [Clostridium sp. AL.422]
MNKNPLTYFKENKGATIASLTVLFLLLFSIFFLTYNSKENRTKRYLKNAAEELNEINSTLPNGIKDLTIDTDITKELLSNGLNNLNKTLISVSDVEETSPDISLTKANLNSALNSTISLYDYSLSTLNNPEGIKNIDDLDKFNVLKETCIMHYSELEGNKINIKFTESTLDYFNNFSNYINTLLKIKRYSEFKDTQTRDFINILTGFKEDILYLNEDLSIAINKVREDKRDLQVIIDDIYKKEELYDSLKEKVALMSIPEGCMDIYESLDEYLNSYSAYLKSIKEAVIYEKTASDTDKLSNEINKNYKNSTSKRDDSLNAYSSYESKLNKF